MAPAGTSKLGGHGRERALVVEADRDEADRSVAVLRDMGYAVHVARDGREALATLSRAPKLVLVNAQPEGGGLVDFLKRLRKLRGLETVPVVAFHTGHPPSVTVQNTLMDAGVGAFLPRPFAPADVAGALSEANGQATSLPEFKPVSAPSMSMVRPERATRPPPEPEPEPEVLRPRVSSLPSSGGLPSFNPASNPSLTGISSASSSSSISAVGEVPATMMTTAGEQDCYVLSANRGRVIVRMDASGRPRKGEKVRLHVRFRHAVADAMQELPVRILGTVMESEPAGTMFKITLSVDIANPQANLDHLNRYLLRFG